MSQRQYTPPADFDSYWTAVIRELTDTPARPEIEAIPMRSTEFANLYGVRLTSIGPYRLFGYLSIPTGDGPFPAIYWPPKYASVLETIPQGAANSMRSRFVTFSCAGRGQRNADKPFAAMFPGLLTEGIESKSRYAFRAIAADGARGLQYLLSRNEVDKNRVAVIGNDLAMQIVALLGEASHLICTPALFFDSLRLAATSSAYPLEELNDFIRFRPDASAAVEETLGYFDLRGFAPAVRANTLIAAGPEGSNLSPDALAPLANSISADTTIYASQQSSYLDGMFIENWIADEMGFDSPILPEVWR